jgi:hypothetical protein
LPRLELQDLWLELQDPHLDQVDPLPDLQDLALDQGEPGLDLQDQDRVEDVRQEALKQSKSNSQDTKQEKWVSEINSESGLCQL